MGLPHGTNTCTLGVVASVEAVEAVEADIAEVCGIINAAHARLVGLVAKVIDEDLWCGAGIVSPEHWVAWQCGLGRGRAAQVCMVARRLRDLPANQALLDAGAVSVDQAAVVARCTPVEKDVEVAAQVTEMTVSQLTRVLSRYVFHDDPPPPDPVEEVREVAYGDDGTGIWRLHAAVPLDEGAVIEAAMVAARDRLFHDAENAEERLGVSWADALLLVAERSQSVGASERPDSDRHRVLMHLEADACGDGHQLRLHLGSILPDPLRRYLLCDTTIAPVIHRDGVALSVGRAQHTVADRARRIIEHRDGACRVPGCERRRGLQVHHIIHWEDGGPTDTNNLVCLCRHHHRLHHLGHLGISGNADRPDGVTVTDRWNRRLDRSGKPIRPERPPGDAARAAGIPTPTYHHPPGERLAVDQAWFGDPIPA